MSSETTKRVIDPATSEKLRRAHTGMRHTRAIRQKISASMKIYWQRRKEEEAAAKDGKE